MTRYQVRPLCSGDFEAPCLTYATSTTFQRSRVTSVLVAHEALERTVSMFVFCARHMPHDHR